MAHNPRSVHEGGGSHCLVWGLARKEGFWVSTEEHFWKNPCLRNISDLRKKVSTHIKRAWGALVKKH